MEKPKVVGLCGSSRFVDVIAVCGWLIERDEKPIAMGLHLLPDWYGPVPDHIAEAEGCADEMDEMHLRKIDLCNDIFVVDFRNYIGPSTTREIKYAEKLGKPVRRFTQDKIGRETLAILLRADKTWNPGLHRCRVCGCTEDHACPGGCSWVGLDLCSTCASLL